MPRTITQTFRNKKDSLINRPIRLIIVEDGGSGNLGSEVLRYAVYGENVIYNSQTYYAAPIKIGNITENLSQEIDSLSVTISSVDQTIIHYLEQHGALIGCKVTIRIVFADLLNDTTAFTDSVLYVSSASLTQTGAAFLLKSQLSFLDIELPRRKFYREICQWKFKSPECGYPVGGPANSCNHTPQRCQELNNLTRIGCFPGTGFQIQRVYIG